MAHRPNRVTRPGVTARDLLHPSDSSARAIWRCIHPTAHQLLRAASIQLLNKLLRAASIQQLSKSHRVRNPTSGSQAVACCMRRKLSKSKLAAYLQQLSKKLRSGPEAPFRHRACYSVYRLLKDSLLRVHLEPGLLYCQTARTARKVLRLRATCHA